MRIHNEPITVRLPAAEVPDATGAAPVQFVWRRRLWRVLEVQRAWAEAGAWWDDPRIRRARGQDADSRRPGAPDGPSPPGGNVALDGDLPGDWRVWRVEASVGAGGEIGVYELACRGSNWWLRAVVD